MSYGTGKKVLHTRDADHPGYVHVIMLDPIGGTQAGELVRSEKANGDAFEIILHGQREFDVPGPLARIVWADGTTWQPGKPDKG